MSTLLEKLIGSAALKDNPLKCLCIKLKPGSVTTDKIADKAVTPAKLSDSVKTDLIQAPINAVQENLDNHVSDTVKHITAQERSTWNSKQDALTFDNLPTQGSNNPVKSKGIKSAIDDVQNVIDSRISYNELDFKKTIAADVDNEINIKARTPGGSSDGHVEINTDNLIINNTESADINLASGSNVNFDGIGSITSDMGMTIQAGKTGASTGDLNLNGTNVKINGKNADWAVEKVDKMYDPSGMGRSDFNIEKEGIYFTKFNTDPLTGSSLQYFRCYLLLVGTEMRITSSGLATFLDQTLIRLDGTIYKRSIQLPSSGDIDWSTAPNFTEV